MARKRPSALDALGDVAPPTPPTPPEPQALAKPKPVTYRLPEPLIDQLRLTAQTERVKISDLITYALQQFMNDYESGKIKLPKAEPAIYKLNF